MPSMPSARDDVLREIIVSLHATHTDWYCDLDEDGKTLVIETPMGQFSAVIMRTGDAPTKIVQPETLDHVASWHERLSVEREDQRNDATRDWRERDDGQ